MAKKKDKDKISKEKKIDKVEKTVEVVKEKVEKIEKVNDDEKKEVKEEQPTSLVKSLIELALIIIAIIVILVFFPNTPVWNIVVLLLILTVLIFVHEGGHFIVGKLCKVHVYEFALGMGPRILFFKRKNDPTEYSLRCLPIGGYCQMAGEEGEDDNSLPKDKFMCNKSKIQRILILVAGVTMNFITALILLFFIGLIWGSTDQSNVIDSVQEGSPAAEAGLVAGDKILKVNGHNIVSWDVISLVSYIKNDNEYYTYLIQHENGDKEEYKITPAEYIIQNNQYVKVTDDMEIDENTETYKIIGIGKDGTVVKGFINAIKYAFSKFGSIVYTMILTVWWLITGKLSLDSLSGPVGMYTIVEQVAGYGIANILYLMAYLSINLGVINILPFPAFDGGRVLFVLIEAVTGKKVNPEVEGWFHTIGFILLMILMLVITGKDISKLFNR